MKKSARQIYAEAFMEEDNLYTRTNTRDYADDAALKEEFEKRKKKAAEEGDEVEEIDSDATTSNKASETITDDAEDDPLDKLTRTEEEL